MADRELVVKFDGKDAGLDKAAKNAGQSIDGVSKAHSNFVVTAGDVTNIAKSVIGVLGDAAKAAAEDEQQQANLRNQLKNVVGATDDQVASVEKWINKTQNATGVLDDNLRPALQNLVVATGSVDQAQGLMGTAMDIAQAKGLDLQAVTAAMAKAHDGNSAALHKMGIETTDASGAALSFDQVMQSANSTFGGATAAAAETSAGKMAILKAKFSDVQETVGGVVIGALTKFGDFVTGTLVPGISKLSDFIVKNKEYFLAAAVGIVGALVPAFIAWATAAATAAGATITTAAPVIAVGVAIAALAAGIIYAYNHFDTFRNVVDAVGRFFRDTVWPIIKQGAEYLVDFGKFAYNTGVTVGEFAVKVGKVVGGMAREIADTMSSVANTLISPFRSAFNAIARLWNGTVGSIEFTVPSWVPGIGGNGFSVPNIPQLADGGIVNRPTLALIGEAGPEAVVPLGRGGFGGGPTIIINMPPGSNGEDVVSAIQRYERTAGKGWRS
jgi:hypothetical protein